MIHDNPSVYTSVMRRQIRQVAQANDVHLSSVRELIAYLSNRIERLRAINWPLADRLEAELTDAMSERQK